MHELKEISGKARQRLTVTVNKRADSPDYAGFEDLWETAEVAEPGEARQLLPAGERYTLGEELGRGGMGSVVLARDNVLGRTVAMKRLLSSKPPRETLRRFLQEAQVTGQLEHPNVIDVHEVGTDAQGHPYFTMQYIRGNETLETVIERLREGDPDYHRRYTMERRVQIVIQIARALEFAHSRGVIHRDIKPANIMVGPFAEVLLLDWGLAKVLDAEGLAPRTDGPSVGGAAEVVGPLGFDPLNSDDQSIMGTPFYMAPEHIRDEAEKRSDLYSLTAVLQELLSLSHYLGQPSWELNELIEQILEQQPKAPDADYDPLNGRVPGSLARICAKGLEKDSDQRFQSAGALADALQAWLEGQCEVACPNSMALHVMHSWRRTLQDHPGPATLGSLAAAAVCLFSVVFTLGKIVGAL